MALELKIAIAVLGLLAGCAQEPALLVLAEVGGEPITEGDFAAFDARIPDGMKQAETPEEARRQVLESLIDKKLLLLEAADAGIAQDPWFLGETERFERARAREIYIESEVAGRIKVGPEEVERHYRASGRHRALRLGGIMVADEAEARGIVDRLAAGADFHTLASSHSVHEETAARGGDTGVYQTRDQMSEVTVGHVLDLAVGEVSEPVREIFDHGDYYVIYKILDEIPAPLSASERIVVDEIAAEKRQQRLQAITDSLVAAYAPEFRAEEIESFIAAYADAAELDRGAVLCRYRGGELTVDGFLQAFESLRRRPVRAADAARAEELLRLRILPDLFFTAEIAASGVLQDAGFQTMLAVKKEELALSALRRREIDRHVEVSVDEARRFYDDHPEKFSEPETTTIAEILVATDSLARRLRGELEAGADAVELVVQHTRREGVLHHDGMIRLNIYNQGLFPILAEAVGEVAAGQVGGPIKTEEGYSVFKVLDRVREPIPYHGESQRRARAYLQIAKSKRGYVQFVRNLRYKYPVTIHEENLRKVGTGAAQG